MTVGELHISAIANSVVFKFKMNNYGHPASRMINDVCTMDAIIKTCPNPNDKLVIADIGSKWRKTVNMLSSIGYTDFKIIAIRPTIIPADADYLRNNLTTEQFAEYK